ncbi:MAG: 3-deoxy-7-phosphoheptulonate synthase [Betaproteobacteria bacterium]|nr:3-deoxy-7-phosphoheptulonate synthase [Betaproteobacteria bacterium]
MQASITEPIDDLRVREIDELVSPETLFEELPATAAVSATARSARQAIHRALTGADDRMIAVVGPCSIHDQAVALDYARRLAGEAKRLEADLLVVMRVYFEKPRTTVGWKGLINDPALDGTYRVNEGLRLARKLLIDINSLGLPTGQEFLDPITPQYLADLAAWGAIGARTTESQVHRELASGLSCPIGFKNGTDGNVRIAVDAIRAARHPHRFLGVTKAGRSAVVETTGNEDCHLILRGGKEPNYDAASVASACAELAAAGQTPQVMVDASHGNSRKQYQLQVEVMAEVARQVAQAENRIVGAMVESNLVAGRQDLVAGKPLEYGVSITDGCIAWEDTVRVLDMLAGAVRERRLKLAQAD